MDKFIFEAFKRFLFRILLFCADVLRLIEVFFLGGERCLGCGRLCGSVPVCKRCMEKLVYSGNTLKCSVCGKELVSELDLCSSCRNSRILFEVDKVYPAAPYRLWRKNLLFAWKTEEKRVLSPFFARLAYQKLMEISGGQDNPPAVVPVPPRPHKIRKQGWDQVDELCFYLKNLYGIKVFHLLRRLSVYQQKKLDRKNRLTLTKNSFALEKERVLKRYRNNLPEEIVLVDDIMTTGSTLEACAALLKSIGIKKVLAVTLFIVD